MDGQRLAAIRLKVHPAALVMSCAADARPNAGKGLTMFGLKAIVGKILTVQYSRAWAFEDESTVQYNPLFVTYHLSRPVGLESLC